MQPIGIKYFCANQHGSRNPPTKFSGHAIDRPLINCKSKLRSRNSKRAALGCNTEVAAHHELSSSTERRSVDRCNDRHFALGKRSKRSP
jgi:hypothetical protein